MCELNRFCLRSPSKTKCLDRKKSDDLIIIILMMIKNKNTIIIRSDYRILERRYKNNNNGNKKCDYEDEITTFIKYLHKNILFYICAYNNVK